MTDKPKRITRSLTMAPDVWDKLTEIAEQERRSVTGQVEVMLRDAIDRVGQQSTADAPAN